MELRRGHFVAVVGGAVAGSAAAARLASRGIYVAVFEQHERPYGKIEDGLPKWHVLLQAQEERRIDERLARPEIFFVPCTRLGKDLDFHALVTEWGFSAVLLANGAWKDRPLPIAGAERCVGRGLVYQNPLVTWFNHEHEPDYAGPRFEIPDGAVVIGGGLASLDVVKIVMLATVLPALHRRGIAVDLLTLETRSIAAVLEEHGLALADLGLAGCTLLYRRRMADMPVTPLAPDAPPEVVDGARRNRERLVRLFERKFLFRFEERRIPTALLVDDDRVVGLRHAESDLSGGRCVPKPGTEAVLRAPLVVSSIGSIPEPIPGIRMNGELYEVKDPRSGQFVAMDHVFALGNVVTGKGNIKASLDHGLQVADFVMDEVLDWHDADYQSLVNHGVEEAHGQARRIEQFLRDKHLLDERQVAAIVARIRERQHAVRLDADYKDWIVRHPARRFDASVSREAASRSLAAAGGR
jgi:ferredoxin--NADP+ reductase